MEAPGIEQFARENEVTLRVIGLGTQDNLDMANEFADDFDITHTLLWDESFQSWAELGVSLQPSSKLFAADGTLLREWLGPFDEEAVLELIAGSEADPTQDAASAESFCRFTDRFARAQRDASRYADSDSDGRQRILDDLRYAANAMAQTAQSDNAESVERLASAVRAHSQVLLDAGLDADPSSIAGRDNSARDYRAAIVGVDDLSISMCGVSLEPVAAP